MKSYFIIHLLLGPLMLVIAIIFRMVPPKKINSLYGYRTPRSMKSQEAWNIANSYSAKFMVWASIATCFAQIVLHLLFENQHTVIIGSTIALTVFILGVFPLTEQHLKNKLKN